MALQSEEQEGLQEEDVQSDRQYCAVRLPTQNYNYFENKNDKFPIFDAVTLLDNNNSME